MTPRLTIYIAGRYSRRAELLEVARWLETLGARVTARWLEGGHDHLPPMKCADDDLEDIRASEGVLFFTETATAGYMSGGRHFELGAAYAWGKWIWIVGEPENVFHHTRRVNRYASVVFWAQSLLGDVDTSGAPPGAFPPPPPVIIPRARGRAIIDAETRMIKMTDGTTRKVRR